MNKELIITFSWYGIGGAQRRVFNLAEEFVKLGYKVYILAVLGRDATIIDENFYSSDNRINLIIVPEFYQKVKELKEVVESDKKINQKIAILKKMQLLFKPFRNVINYKISSLRKSKSIRSFLISHPEATIINFGFNTFDRIFFAIKGLKNKIIYAETNASNKYSFERYFELTKKTIKKSDAFIFQTEEEANEHGLVNRKNVYIIHNPINSNLPLPYFGARDKTIVNFCRLSRQKNLLLLIQAFEKLHCTFPDYTLKIYADTSDPNNTEYKKELISYILNRGLENSVFLLPPSSDIHNIILDCAMFVSSSDYEGISNSMIEAMAIGLPCVCTDCDGGGAREMITDGENGLLVPVGDAEALKNAMARMIAEKGLADKCSKNAAKIRDSHSIEKISEKWLNVINNI